MNLKILLVALTGAGSLVLSACSLQSLVSQMPHMEHESINTNVNLGAKDETFDLRFIDAMTAQYEAGSGRIQQALQKSQRPEIQQLAQAMMDTQDKEIAQMKQWRHTWYPNARNSNTRAIIWLASNDDPFDLQFINAMIPDHEHVVSLSKTALEKSNRPEIQQIAQAIMTNRQQEISQMQQWKQAWYGQ